MKPWRKNKIVDKELPSFVRTGLCKVHQKLIRFANFLQRKTNGYSSQKKKLFLLLFIVAFVSQSIIVFVQSIKGNSKTAITVNRIKSIPIEKAKTERSIVTGFEFSKIKKFKHYIDSLSNTPSGRKTRDSLLYNRPHLMDSVNFLINLYLEQSKTERK